MLLFKCGSMKKENIKQIIIFCLLIITIIIIILINIYQNKKLDVNRKKVVIFNKYSYNYILNEGKNIFFNTYNLMNNNILQYEEKSNQKVIYKINNQNYYKIINYDLINNLLTKKAQNELMNDQNIILDNNEYYIEIKNIKNSYNYVGSFFEITSYNDKFINFKTTNYFCDNYEYIGRLEVEPQCDFKINNTNFTITLENNLIKLTSYNEIKNSFQ